MSEELRTECEYQLQVPFEYSKGGTVEEARMVLLVAPAAKNRRECLALKQAFFRAIDRDTSKAEEPGEIGEISGPDIMMTLAMSPHVELDEVVEIAIKLLTSGETALVDGEQKLTKPLVDKMHIDDLEGMVGAYLANFTLASSLARMRTQSEKASPTS